MTQEEQNPFKTLTKNLPFHNFEQEDTLTCMVKERVNLGEDDKAFEALEVVDMLTGESKFVTISYAIDRAVNKAFEENEGLDNLVFLIVFRGKTEIKGKPFNQFDVSVCSLEAYEEYNR